VSGKKNLIMGLWSRLPFEGLERFIASLRRTTFDGDVCVFVDEVPAVTVRSLMAHGVMVERASRFALSQMNYQGSRYYSYLDFLGRRGDEYANVMISDLRDVLFQADPFATELPADLVFAQERCRLGDCPTNRSWIIQAYGEAMADNLRHCMVSCSGTTFGTVRGMQQYLTLMINELAGRPIPIVGGMDQGIHNYLIRMRPVRNAYCDPTDSIVATMAYTPDDAISIDQRGVLIDGRLVPVIHQWDRKEVLREYIEAASQFRLSPEAAPHYPIMPRRAAPQPPEPIAADRPDAVLCLYHRERDADWLEPFLATLRTVGFPGRIHCLGAFDPNELAVLARHGAVAHGIDPIGGDLDHVDNLAHVHMSRVLDQLAADASVAVDQVLVMATMRAGFLRDPFLSKTIGLSVFCEGPARIGDSDYNSFRLQQFTELDDVWRQRPVVASSVLRGRLDVVRAYYRKLLAEFIGRTQLLEMHNMIQGAFNKLCQGEDFDFPVILHPNAAEVYFEIGPQNLTIDMRLGVRIGGTVPAVVVSPYRETPLMDMLRGSLHLSSVMAPN
jgi:hypothetical protein